MSKPKKITRQARHASRVRAERLALGLCIQCGRLPASYRCATCRAQASAATAKRRRLAAAKKLNLFSTACPWCKASVTATATAGACWACYQCGGISYVVPQIGTAELHLSPYLAPVLVKEPHKPTAARRRRAKVS